MIAGQLEVVIAADVARISRDMEQAKGVISSGMQHVTNAVGMAKAALASLGVGIGAGALVALGKNAIDAADHLNDLSKSTGLAVEELSGLGIAAKQSGTDLDGVASAVNKLSVNMGQHSEKFRALGITAKDPLEAFKQLADVFSAIQDPQLRAAIGAEALGKSWASAAPLLSEGGAKIGEMVEKGKLFSGVTKEMAEQSDALNDKLVLLTGTHGTLNRAIGPLLPLLNQLADQLLKSREEAAKLGGTDFSFLLEAAKAIVVVFGGLVYSVKAVGTEIGALAARFAAVAVGDFKRANEITVMAKEDADAARTAFVKWREEILAVGKASTTTAGAVAGMSEETLEAARIAEAAGRAFLEAEKRKKEAADAAKKAAEEAFKLRVAHAEAELKAEEMFAHDYAEAWKWADFYRNKEAKEAADEREFIAKHEAEGEEEFARQYYEAWKYANDFILAEQKKRDKELAASAAMVLGTWTDIGDRIGRFFSDVVVDGRKAFDSLKNMVKDFARELIAIFARKWILSMGASILGSGAGDVLASAASTSGAGTFAGSILSTLFGGPGAVTSTGLAEPATGLFASLFAEGGALGSIGAAIGPLTSVLGPLAIGIGLLVSFLNSRRGGPKDEGTFGQTSILSGTNDESLRQIGEGLGQSFAAFLERVGGRSTLGPNPFSLGLSVDPRGTSPTFLDAILRGPGGDLYRSELRNVGRGSEEIKAALDLETKRMLLAALQASDLPAEVAEILNSVSAVTGTAEEIDRVTAAALAWADAAAQAAATAAAAAEQMKTDWAQAQDLIDRLSGRDPSRRHLGDAVSAFAAANPWAAGLTPAELVSAFKTITEEDFKAYSAENRKLILAILGLADSMDETAATVTQAAEAIAQAIYFPEVGAQTLQEEFQRKYGGLIGSSPSLMGQLSLGAQLMQGQVATWQQQQAGLSQYSPEWQTLQKAIEDFQQRIAMTAKDIADLAILTAQYGEAKAEELFNLQKWYDAQKLLVEGNKDAMDALAKIFGDKWRAIIDGIASDDSKSRLAEWWRGLFLDDRLSPLTPQQKFDLAKSDYEKAIAGGDSAQIQQAATAFLDIAHQILGGPEYVKILRQVAEQTGAAALISQAEINSRLYGALPSSEMATSASVLTVRDEIRNLQTQIADGISVRVVNAEPEEEEAGSGLFAR